MDHLARDLELARERDSLAKADRDLSEGEERITRQIALVERLRQDGHSVTEAQSLLDTLQQTLQIWREHRALIVQRIAHLEGLAIEPAPGPTSPWPG